MDKLKNMLSPGQDKDDSLMYGSESGPGQQTGSTGRISGQGSHLSAAGNDGHGPHTPAQVGPADTKPTISESTTGASQNTNKGSDSHVAGVNKSTADGSQSQNAPNSSTGVESGAAAAAANKAWASHDESENPSGTSHHMPGEFPDEDDNPYRTSHLDPRVGGPAGTTGASGQTHSTPTQPATKTDYGGPRQTGNYGGDAGDRPESEKASEQGHGTTARPDAALAASGAALSARGSEKHRSTGGMSSDTAKQPATSTTGNQVDSKDLGQRPSQETSSAIQGQQTSPESTFYERATGTLAAGAASIGLVGRESKDQEKPEAVSSSKDASSSIAPTQYDTSAAAATSRPAEDSREQSSTKDEGMAAKAAAAATAAVAAGATAVGLKKHDDGDRKEPAASLTDRTTTTTTTATGAHNTQNKPFDSSRQPGAVQEDFSDGHHGKGAAFTGGSGLGTGSSPHDVDHGRKPPAANNVAPQTSAQRSIVASDPTSQTTTQRPLATGDTTTTPQTTARRPDEPKRSETGDLATLYATGGITLAGTLSNEEKPGSAAAKPTEPGAPQKHADEDLHSEHHRGRNVGTAAGVGAGAGAVGHELSQKEVEKAEKEKLAQQKAHEKDLAKEHKAHDKELAKEHKAHEKELAKEQRHHEKEQAREQKAYEKEQKAEQKAHDKAVAREEKKHEKGLAADDKLHEKELARRRSEEEREEREEKEKKPGLVSRILHRHHDKDEKPAEENAGGLTAAEGGRPASHAPEDYAEHNGRGSFQGSDKSPSAHERERALGEKHGRSVLHKDPPPGYTGRPRGSSQAQSAEGRVTPPGSARRSGDNLTGPETHQAHYAESPTKGYASQSTGGTGTAGLAQGEGYPAGSHLNPAGDRSNPVVGDHSSTLPSSSTTT